MPFEPFGKIGRLSRDVIVTEKIDGTNAQVELVPMRDVPDADTSKIIATRTLEVTDSAGSQQVPCAMFAGSRSRYITPDADNFGFAAWVQYHADALWTLGIGRHFGEWWGAGINKRYGPVARRWSLFNTTRWATDRPTCCDIVPVLYQGPFSTTRIDELVEQLRATGSVAAPGCPNPEGVVVYHPATHTMFKKTLVKDDAPKSSYA